MYKKFKTQNTDKLSINFKNISIFCYLTGLYIFIWYLQIGNRIQSLGEIRFEFILGTILSVGALIKFNSKSNKRFYKNKNKRISIINAIIFYFLIVCIYTVFSYDRSTSITVFVNYVFKYSLLALFIYVFTNNSDELKLIVLAFLAAWLKLGQEGFYGWFTGSMIWYSQGIPRLHGTTGVLLHPNSFSGFAVSCIPFIYYLYKFAYNRMLKIIFLIFAIFVFIIIVYTGSRTGYLTTLMVLLYFLFSSHIKKAKYILLLMVLAIVVLNYLPEDYHHRFVSIFTLEEKEGQSSKKRIQILKDAVEIYMKYPLGLGVSAFPKVRQDIFGRHQDTHNLYLQVLTNIGPLGFFAFFYLLYIIIKINRELVEYNSLNGSGNIDNEFRIALSNAVILFIYIRLFLGIFGMDLYEIYWWFALGITLANRNLSMQELKHESCVKPVKSEL